MSIVAGYNRFAQMPRLQALYIASFHKCCIDRELKGEPKRFFVSELCDKRSFSHKNRNRK